MTSIRPILLLAAVLSLLVAGCTGAVVAPSPSPSTSPQPVPVTTPEQAVARVIAHEPRLTGIMPFDPELIGQASWYKVAPASGVGAFVVTVRIGWGDCEAGCIDEHTWVYAVAPDGTVSVVSETGAPAPDEAWPAPVITGRTGIGGKATAGPVCPVERVPPDPGCAPRPMAGAVIVIRDASGAEVARVTTAADGTYFAALAPGRYNVEPQAAKGVLGVPGPAGVTVIDGFTTTVDLGYDTGIR